MAKKIITIIAIAILILSYGFATTQLVRRQGPQMQQRVVVPDCFTKYFDAGNKFIQEKNYDEAIKQYEAAKACVNLPNDKKRQLDSLIMDAYRKKQALKKG